MRTWHLLALTLPLLTTSSLAEESTATLNETFVWIKSMLEIHGSVEGKGTTQTPTGTALLIRMRIAVAWSGRKDCDVRLNPRVSYRHETSEWVNEDRGLGIRIRDLDFESVRLLPLKQSKLYRLFRDDSIQLEGDPWVLEISSTPPAKAYTATDDKGEDYGVSVGIPFLANRKDIAERAVNAWAHAIKLCGGKKPAF